MAKILVIGSGFSGAVLAEQLAAHTDHKILVVDERSHIGGNCHTERDPTTGVMVHMYGPHIFHTSNESVWRYVQRFGTFSPNLNRVKAVTDRGVFSLPINLLTINQLFHKTFNPREAEAFIKSISEQKISEPENFEEQSLKMIGSVMYETFIRGYTRKQWGCDPRDLPASILKRMPIRFTYDDNYYDDKYQGVPVDGYSVLIGRMLSHSKISIQLNQRYDRSWNVDFDYVFYSGAIDRYFAFKLGRLGYRSIYFESEIFNGPDYQGNPVINYCQESVPYTRIHEHKHFAPWEAHTRSIYFREYSKESEVEDTPFYPKRLVGDMALLKKYRDLAEAEPNVSFVGRLGTYRYLDMHNVIQESLLMAEKFVSFASPWEKFPKFPNQYL